MPNDEVGPRLELRGKRVVLLLQGGGALGAYQVGAHAALAQACGAADTAIAWVGGVSIGAINAAVIAGPKSGDAAAELRALWNEILSPPFPPYDTSAGWDRLPPALRANPLAPLVPKYANWAFSAFNPLGQPHFFGSRVLDPLANPWIAQWLRPLSAGELAFYDTAPLRATLDRHVDWAAIARSGATRLSLGATRVHDGETVFFNSFASRNPQWPRCALGADHVLASAALPPAFPAIAVGTELYWDGGLSSNTPITELAEDLTADATRDTIVFLVDLWDRKGPAPRSFDDVFWRQKSIAYGSRKDAAAAVVDTHELEVEAGRTAPARLEVCQLMLERQPGDTAPQFAYADADFSESTHALLEQLGSGDMRDALERPQAVRGVGGKYATLYRHGTYGKHRATDGSFEAQRARKRATLRAPSVSGASPGSGHPGAAAGTSSGEVLAKS
jgi:predicted acylesterase/phospholipase RssA